MTHETSLIGGAGVAPAVDTIQLHHLAWGGEEKVVLPPAARDPELFTATVRSKGNCVVAHLRKAVGGGTVLLLEGTDVGAVEAGCDLLTDEARIKSLYDWLKIRAHRVPLPNSRFWAKQLSSSVQDYAMVAQRVAAR